MGLYAKNNQFFAIDMNGKLVWNLTIGDIEQGQISTPILDYFNKNFFVKIVFFDHWEIWSLPQPPVQKYDESFIEISTTWEQCGSSCKFHEDCDGYSCSRCLSGTCQPGQAIGSACEYRGDCDERISTCLYGQCQTLNPGCGDPCDYYATCGSEPGNDFYLLIH